MGSHAVMEEEQAPIKLTFESYSDAPLIKFQENSSIVVTGSSKSGKTYWINKFLKNIDDMFSGEPPAEVLYFYLHDQPLYSEMKKNLQDRITFKEGVPTTQDIMEFAQDDQHRLIVLDDIMHLVVNNKDIALLATNLVHHKNMSCLIVYQNLFSSGKEARTISLNTAYLVIFKNVRDKAQIAHLGRQIYPKNKLFMEAYTDAVRAPHSYLLIDMTAITHDSYRLRSHIFPGEQLVVYEI